MGKLLATIGLSFMVGCGGGLENKFDVSVNDASFSGVEVSDAGGIHSDISEEKPSYWCDGGSNKIGDWFVDYLRLRGEVDRNSLNKRMKRMYKLADIYHSRAREVLTSCRLSSKNIPNSLPALGSAFLHLGKGIDSAIIKGYLETALVLMGEVRVQQWESKGTIVGDYFDFPGGF